MKLNHKVGFSSVIFAVVGVVFLVSTNPQNLAPILLIAPFILFFLSLLFAVVFVTTLMAKSDRPSITRKSFILTVLIAGYPVMLLLLQSIGQLSLRDVITLTLIVLLSGFYVTKSSFSS